MINNNLVLGWNLLQVYTLAARHWALLKQNSS